MKRLAIVVMFGIIGGNILINAEEHNKEHPLVYVAEAQVIEPRVVLIESRIDWTEERIAKEVEEQAKKYGRNPDYLKAIIECESQGSTTIQSFHKKNGVREDSWGLVQIHLPSHTTITKEQAIDPKFAIEFLAKNIGKVKWSCEDLI